MNSFLKPAVFDRTVKDLGGITQTGEEHIAIIEINGVQFRSWLPGSEAECQRINHVGSVIIASAVFPVAKKVPLELDW